MTRKPRLVFKIVIILLTLLALETLVLAWLWHSTHPRSVRSSPESNYNAIARLYPGVDFKNFYPGMSYGEIDQLQRACLGVRNVYAPFVEFRPLPVTNQFVTITSAGFRAGHTIQPWPPSKSDFVIFVFGGSTTFGFGLRDPDTVVAALEGELAARWPERNVRCYNFGVCYYFSTQERLLLEQLLQSGVVPNLAIFVDGLNDFYYRDGRPELTKRLTQFIAEDLPPEPPMELSTESDRVAAAKGIIRRYANHVRLTQVLAEAFGFKVIFIGQPVPFLYYTQSEERYPFRAGAEYHEFCSWGYNRFEAAGRAGELGTNFVWCGDAFTNTTTSMYVDAVHYSAIGATVLAKAIARRSGERRLLPSSAAR